MMGPDDKPIIVVPAKDQPRFERSVTSLTTAQAETIRDRRQGGTAATAAQTLRMQDTWPSESATDYDEIITNDQYHQTVHPFDPVANMGVINSIADHLNEHNLLQHQGLLELGLIVFSQWESIVGTAAQRSLRDKADLRKHLPRDPLDKAFMMGALRLIANVRKQYQASIEGNPMRLLIPRCMSSSRLEPFEIVSILWIMRYVQIVIRIVMITLM